jgi:hypothetical protein
MVDDDVRHPVLVDTDALIAVANTSLWQRIVETLQLMTTNVCYHELTRHKRETSEHAPDGTREKWLHDGCTNALDVFDAETDSFTVVSCVLRPHSEDAGEESLRTEIEQHPETYRFVILMDKHGRRPLNRVFEQTEGKTGKAVVPTFLLYLLLDVGTCTVEEFCHACGDLLRGEGWVGYQAIQAAWEAIPVDCAQYLSTDLLP